MDGPREARETPEHTHLRKESERPPASTSPFPALSPWQLPVSGVLNTLQVNGTVFLPHLPRSA